MKELLADKNRLKIDVRIVYGKSELQPQEIEWLRGLTYIRTSFCAFAVGALPFPRSPDPGPPLPAT